MIIFSITSLISWLECKVRDSCGTSVTGETPNGAVRQEAHRTPRGKRATWNGNQLHSKTTKFAKTENRGISPVFVLAVRI
jgi:hypothetical protein